MAKFYAIANGWKVGIVRTWAECQARTTRYSHARFKSCATQKEAEAYIKQHQRKRSHSPDAPSIARTPTLTHSASTLNCTALACELTSIAGAGVDDVAATAIMMYDGGSRGNPGLAGSGAVVLRDGKEIATCRLRITRGTNNEAEYLGMIIGLRLVKRLGISKVRVIGDSELLTRQMNGVYQLKAPGLIPLNKYANRVSTSLSSCVFEHVLRDHNKRADELANEAMDDSSSEVCRNSSHFLLLLEADTTSSKNSLGKKSVQTKTNTNTTTNTNTNTNPNTKTNTNAKTNTSTNTHTNTNPRPKRKSSPGDAETQRNKRINNVDEDDDDDGDDDGNNVTNGDNDDGWGESPWDSK